MKLLKNSTGAGCMIPLQALVLHIPSFKREEKAWKICQLFEPELSFNKRWIALCAAKSLIQYIGSATLIHWMVIYQVDGLSYSLNNLSFLFILKQVFFFFVLDTLVSCYHVQSLMAPKNVETVKHHIMNLPLQNGHIFSGTVLLFSDAKFCTIPSTLKQKPLSLWCPH